MSDKAVETTTRILLIVIALLLIVIVVAQSTKQFDPKVQTRELYNYESGK